MDLSELGEFGAVLLEHSLMNEANYNCNCGEWRLKTAEQYVAHFQAALAAAGLEVVQVDEPSAPR